MTDAVARARSLVQALEPGCTATVTREFLAELVEAKTSELRDLTVAEIAERFGRSHSCIRSWLEQGVLRGYRLRNREWKVTPAALAAFEEAERSGENARNCARRSRSDVALSAWRTAT